MLLKYNKIDSLIVKNNFNINIFLITFYFYSNNKKNLIAPVGCYYNWLCNNNNFVKLYYIKNTSFCFSSFFIKNKVKVFSKTEKALNIISSKKKYGVIKNEFNLKKAMLLKFHNDFANLSKWNKNYFLKNEFDRSYDLKKKLIKILEANRAYLSLILKKKFRTRKQYSRFLKNFTKINFRSRILSIELSLKNILLRSNFFFSTGDLNRFLLENSIFVNGLVVNKLDKILKKGDCVSIEFNENYFFYFRKTFDTVNYYHNRMNNVYNKYSRNRYKKININRKIQNYINTNNDVPHFLEIDYTTMTIHIIDFPKNTLIYNPDILNFLNLYLSRAYLWKYIV